MKKWLLAILVGSLVTGCMVNPVTGSRELVLVGEREEILLGEQLFATMQAEQGGVYTKHPEVGEYVRRVGQKLAAVSDRPGLPYEFVVLNNDVPNAWTLPGGKIAINTGLLRELESEAELAAVLSHEIVHAAGRHGAQAIETGVLVEIAANAGAEVCGEGTVSGELVKVGSVLVMLKYSRDKEFEADRYGICYMARAGYSVQAAVTLQEKLLRLSHDRAPGWIDGLLATHPPSEERVEENRWRALDYPRGGFVGVEEYQRSVRNVL